MDPNDANIAEPAINTLRLANITSFVVATSAKDEAGLGEKVTGRFEGSKSLATLWNVAVGHV